MMMLASPRPGGRVHPAGSTGCSGTWSGRAGRRQGSRRPAAAADPGVLPLLSHALCVTWTKRETAEDEGRTVPVLTVNGYLDSGRISGTLRSTAQQEYDELPPDRQPVARRVFVDLVQFTGTGSTTVPACRPARRADLDRPDDPDGAVDQVVRSFADNRLLTVDEDLVQISYEALLTTWGELAGWLDDDSDWIRLQREVQVDAERWKTTRATDLLYSATRLDGVQERLLQLNHTTAEMVPSSRALLDASHREGQAGRPRHRAGSARTAGRTSRRTRHRRRRSRPAGQPPPDRPAPRSRRPRSTGSRRVPARSRPVARLRTGRACARWPPWRRPSASARTPTVRPCRWWNRTTPAIADLPASVGGVQSDQKIRAAWNRYPA